MICWTLKYRVLTENFNSFRLMRSSGVNQEWVMWSKRDIIAALLTVLSKFTTLLLAVVLFHYLW